MFRIALWSAAAATALFAATTAHAANNAGMPTIPLTLINNSGSGADLWITILGLSNNSWYSVIDKSGDVQAAPHVSGQSTAYSFDVGSAQQQTIQVPALIGARLYVSIGAPLTLNAGNGTPGTPAGWVSSDPNYGTAFDWIEYTWTGNSFGGNTTQVDMFGLALGMSLSGDGGTQSSGFATSSGSDVRSTVLSEMGGAAAPWNALVVRDGNGSPLRAISPYHGIENGVFPSNEYQGYLDQAFSAFPNGGLSTTFGGVSFTGYTSGSAMVFTNQSNGESFRIPEPSTYSLLLGSVSANPTPTDGTLAGQAAQVGAELQAGILRTTLLDDGGALLACNTSHFYQTSPVDQYASILHSNAENGHTYGFGFDDVCGQSSYISVTNPTAMTLSVGPLSAASSAPNLDGTFVLHPQNAPALALDDWASGTSPGNQIDIWSTNGTGAQDWVLSSTNVVPAGDYNIAVSYGAYCLATTGSASGLPVELEPCNGSASQAWHASPSGSGYSFNPASNPALCLDVRSDATAPGTLVQAWTCNNGNNEQWVLD